MTNRCSWVLAALLLMSSAEVLSAQGHFADRSEQYHFSGVTFPAAVDTFLVLRATRWPQPALGIQLHYGSPLAPRGQFDIYVYPVPEPEGAARSVEEEFRTAMGGIRRYADENMEGVEVTVESEDPVTITTPTGETYEGWKAHTTYRNDSSVRRSLLYVFAKDGHFLKYRITHDEERSELLDPRLRAFLEASLGRVVLR